MPISRADHPKQIDVLFTSEWYGETNAQWLGGGHVAIEPMRTSVPIRATQIREHPSALLEYTAPVVRVARAAHRARWCRIDRQDDAALELAAHYSTPRGAAIGPRIQ